MGGPTWGGEGGLSGEEVERYARQTALPGFGPDAQLRLRGSAALVVGAGGLGSPVLLYLAGAGVGRLGIVDRDAVGVCAEAEHRREHTCAASFR